MKIVSLKAENIKRLVAVEIAPTGNLVQITGRNGAGKSSVLDALWWAMAGTRTHQARPIRKGQEEARVELDLGGLLVKRKFTAHEGDKVTTSIIVETDQGARFTSPQRVLDDLVGSLSFDPLGFCREHPEKQAKILCNLVGINLDEFEKAQKEDFAERRVLNRQFKELDGVVSHMEVPEGTPAEPVDITALMQKIREGEARNRERQEEHERRESRRRMIENMRHDIARDKDAIGRFRKQIEAIEGNILALQKTIDHTTMQADDRETELNELNPLWQPFDPEPTRAEIDKAHATNEAVRARKAREDAEAKRNRTARAANKLTERMDVRVGEIEDKIAQADLPVEGLGLEDGKVTLDGLPFDQASDAAQLRVSCAIAMSGNPKLRVLRIRDGSLLDEDSLKILEDMAKGEDFQIWIEQVDTTGKVGFVIEDGQLAQPAKEEEGKGEDATPA